MSSLPNAQDQLHKKPPMPFRTGTKSRRLFVSVWILLFRFNQGRHFVIRACFFPKPPWFIWVEAIVTNHLFALIGDMGNEPGQPIERVSFSSWLCWVFSVLPAVHKVKWPELKARPKANLSRTGKITLTATNRQSNKSAKHGAAYSTDIKPTICACSHHKKAWYG